jgi:hypothetical protein
LNMTLSLGFGCLLIGQAKLGASLMRRKAGLG